MVKKQLIYPIKKSHLPISAGNKARNLQRLLGIGVRIPVTYICDWEAYHRYVADDVSLIGQIETELGQLISPEKKYAIRSSANTEDGLQRSFAGQFKSSLNVQGDNNILQAMWSIWSSTKAPIVQTYLEKNLASETKLSMAILIQEMVDPIYSGVALSKNPVTGGDEVVVEAIKGEGSQLVQGGLTPLRWVNKWGYWLEKADNADVPFFLIERIVAEISYIAKRLKQPVDMEWVFDGNELYWVQMRPITALKNRNVYSNYIPREMLAGIIKPLIYSVNIPLINGVWIRLLSEITGDLGIKPEDLAKLFYYRVYFNMGVLGDIFKSLGLPEESVEMLMGLIPRGSGRMAIKPSWKTFSRLPWILIFLNDKWWFGRKMRRALEEYMNKIKATPYKNLMDLSPHELITSIDQHFRLLQELAYFNVVGPLMMMMYNQVVKNSLAKAGVDINNFDLTEDMRELASYDPATYLRELHREFHSLPEEIQDRIRTITYPELLELNGAETFSHRVSYFIERFGHLSDNGNDFSVRPWRESPEMILEMVFNFDPAPEERHQKIKLDEIAGHKQLGIFFKLFYRRAREFRLLREQVSMLYTYGYGLFRYYYLALGEQFTNRGILEHKDDIFYLTKQQVQDLAEILSPPKDLHAIIEQHKADIKRYENIPLPTVIYGEETPPISDESQDTLIGVPASIGYYTGSVRIVTGIHDFSKVKDGDVLVIPYSEVSWSPLFARAGAVVAESGGLLSHSSIIAREYGIPAVVSANGAMKLSDNMRVSVDGQKGIVIIHPPS